jgi:acetylornithine deacetylase/succinyl-diaminopimelate desuccinylase-like protein
MRFPSHRGGVKFARRAYASVGTIAGGFTVSAVPDHCRFAVDRRLLPDETGAGALAEFAACLHRSIPRPNGVEISERLTMEMPAMETPVDHPLIAAMQAAARDAGAPDFTLGGIVKESRISYSVGLNYPPHPSPRSPQVRFRY